MIFVVGLFVALGLALCVSPAPAAAAAAVDAGLNATRSLEPKGMWCVQWNNKYTCESYNYQACFWDEDDSDPGIICLSRDLCDAGSIPTSGTRYNCTVCPAGTYQSGEYGESYLACSPCPAPGWSYPGSTTCYAPFLIGNPSVPVYLAPASCQTEWCWGDTTSSISSAAHWNFGPSSTSTNAWLMLAQSPDLNTYVQYYGDWLLLTYEQGYNCGSMTWTIVNNNGDVYPTVPAADVNFPGWTMKTDSQGIQQATTPHMSIICPTGYVATGNYTSWYCRLA